MKKINHILRLFAVLGVLLLTLVTVSLIIKDVIPTWSGRETYDTFAYILGYLLTLGMFVTLLLDNNMKWINIIIRFLLLLMIGPLHAITMGGMYDPTNEVTTAMFGIILASIIIMAFVYLITMVIRMVYSNRDK